MWPYDAFVISGLAGWSSYNKGIRHYLRRQSGGAKFSVCHWRSATRLLESNGLEMSLLSAGITLFSLLSLGFGVCCCLQTDESAYLQVSTHIAAFYGEFFNFLSRVWLISWNRTSWTLALCQLAARQRKVVIRLCSATCATSTTRWDSK